MHQTISKPPEPILLAAARIGTFGGQRPLTGASGFFFEREDRLYLVTSRYVLIDEPSKHFPDRVEIELHTQLDNLTRSTGFSMLLYREGKSVWRDGADSGGEIDVAVIEIERAVLPQACVLQAFIQDEALGLNCAWYADILLTLTGPQIKQS